MSKPPLKAHRVSLSTAAQRSREYANCREQVSMTGLRSQRSMKILASERTMGSATVRSSSDNGNGVVR